MTTHSNTQPTPGTPAPAASAVADEARIRADEAEACARMFAKFHWDAVLNEQIAAKIRSRIPTAEAARIEAEQKVIEVARASVIDLRCEHEEEPVRWSDCGCGGPQAEELADALARLTAPGAGGK